MCALGFVSLLLWLVWDMAGGSNLKCRVQCRVEGVHPPWVDQQAFNVSCADGGAAA